MESNKESHTHSADPATRGDQWAGWPSTRPDYALDALRESLRSLGAFEDAACIVPDQAGLMDDFIACGLDNYTSEKLASAMGRHRGEIHQPLGMDTLLGLKAYKFCQEWPGPECHMTFNMHMPCLKRALRRRACTAAVAPDDATP
ncbi:Gamma-glutamyl kinase domain-containing protein [Pandoravirus kuranda]|uniref:Gamma-glutamyl kinase domain-containing protein n=2 Tax=Pandoravirus TaxID=2060084 RepID=A0AA95J4D5_9VIRU|nr:hypothetical protein pneo_cds_466 [Pandoravirus neocaledonia]AVK76073.1 hypothetical protein pneo_cds_466 [Pandoravirus neocaledonia]WBR14608.1 Gamma-glutamyl kinase domain-containing protein [Pandoravirus kuranda]